jgi:hypothetical protein
MQNYIYRPTPLLRGLYDEYRRIVLGRDPPKDDAKNNDSSDVDDMDNDPHYGAIHLRLFFLNRSAGMVTIERREITSQIYTIACDIGRSSRASIGGG